MNEYTIWQAASEKIAEVDENMRRAASEKLAVVIEYIIWLAASYCRSLQRRNSTSVCLHDACRGE